MATSIVEKYEQILAADPRSRIFVELAKALLERGDHARAIEVCRQGLEHHPSSILGRVIWGRALLESDDRGSALEQFELALALDRTSPYAYNLVGEALVAKGLFREALPVLRHAVELQPADARVRKWLEEASEAAGAPAQAERSPERHPAPAATAGGVEDDERTQPYRPLAPSGGTATSTPPSASPSTASVRPERRGAQRSEAEGRPPTANAAPAPAATATPTPTATAPRPTTPATDDPSHPPPLRSTPPPIRPEAREVTNPRFVLSMLPGEARDEIGPAAIRPSAPAPRDPDEAARIASQYEQALRDRLLAASEPAPSFAQRHRGLLGGAALAIALAGAASVYLAVRARSRAAEAAHAADAARAGLARDTRASLARAAEVLERARGVSSDPEVASLSAQVASVLAADYGDEKARALARTLSDPERAGDGALVARWVLAEKPAERTAAEAAILAAPPSSTPLVQEIAGRILASRGEREAARGRLEIAARANPPLLRALSDLGDATLARGDADGALAFYRAAIAAHPTHARSVTGAAEARLALGRDLDLSRRELAAVDADPGSAPPADLRLRYELASARVLTATGEATAAATRLQRAAETLGKSARLAGALADVYLAARAWDRAEAEASRAAGLEPAEVGWKVLLARARIGRGRYVEALAATEGADGRAVRLQRAIARYDLGQYAEARAELERTARDGRMPAEAAVWYALTDVALGRPARARPLLEKLAATRTPLALVALGRAQAAEGNLDEAERSYRGAVKRDDAAPEGHAALGKLLLARGRTADAVSELSRAVKLDPADVGTRLALGESRIAAGEPGAARAELDAVLLARPRDGAALRALSAAWLAEHQPAEARRAARRATDVDPASPESWLAAARAALADGDRSEAKRLADRAVKAGARGANAAEARRIAAQAGGRKVAADRGGDVGRDALARKR